MNNRKTKKYRKNIKRKYTIKRQYGGEGEGDQPENKQTVANSEINKQDNKEDEKLQKEMDKQRIMDEVENEKKITLPDFGLTDSNNKGLEESSESIADKASDLVDAVALNSIEGVGNLVGVDLSNPEVTGEKLEQIKETLSNPENVEKMKEIVEDASEVGQIALEASKPFIDDFVDKSLDTASKAASDVGEKGVSILLNTIEEIPGAGVVFGTIRSIGNAGEAVVSTVNAGAEIATTYADTLNAATKKFNELMNEKGLIGQRTNESIKEFQNQFKKQADNQLQSALNVKKQADNQLQSALNVKKGGTRKLIKRKNKKSKRVKFSI